jgi:hypothetical protein
MSKKASTEFPVNRRDDSLFEKDLIKVSTRPVFIIGLPRSGTTFLYQMMTDVFPVASLTVYHVVNYNRILLNHHEGTTTAAGQELDERFRSWNMSTRCIDNIALSHSMPEEYGWVLRRWAGSFHTNTKTAPLLDEICRKLHFIMPIAEAVLLKNPYDTGYVDNLMAHFPHARFIFLQRDPVSIVNSQFRIAKSFSESKNLFVNMLLSGIPLGRAWVWLQRAVRKVAGKRLHGQIALHYILCYVTRELSRLERSWGKVLPHQGLAIDYAELMTDLSGVLERVEGFLKLASRRDPVFEKPNPRDPTLLPEVAAAEAGFRRRLRKRGIAQRPLDEIREST